MNGYNKLKLLAILGLYPLDAYGYFDPGTGSLLIQLAIALVAGATLFFRRVMSKISILWQKLKPSSIPIPSKHALLAGLVGLFTAVFYSSNNSDNLTMSFLIINITLMVGFSVMLVIILSVSLKNVRRKDVILDGVILLMGIYYLRFPIVGIIQFVRDYNIFGIAFGSAIVVLLIAVVFTLVWKRHRGNAGIGHGGVILCLLIALFTPTYQVFTSVISNSSYSEEHAIPLHDSVLQGIDTRFQKRSNVYFFVLDSYTSIAAIKTMGLVGVEGLTSFYSKLQDQGFILYPNFFTNFQRTNYAMASYFNMDTKHRGNSIYRSSVVPDLQEIVASTNPVYKIFSDNKYDIKKILSDRFLVGNRCKTCVFGNEQRQRYLSLFDKIVAFNLLTPIIDSPPKKLPQSFFKQQSSYYTHDWRIDRKTQHVLTHLAEQYHGSNSHLTFVHFYLPYHTELTGRCDQGYETQKYSERLSDTHRVLLPEIKKIIENDDQSLIILAGDHGPFIFDQCSSNPAMRTIEEIIEPQGAFLAIKWGGGDYDGRYDRHIKSSANLFRYIFSYLMGHEQLLQNKPDDDAFYLVANKIVKTIDDGVIVLQAND